MQTFVPHLKEYTIADGVRAFSTKRQMGESTGEYAAFNINRYCGDTPEAIQHNTQALCRLLNIHPDHLILPHQAHGVESRIIADDFFGLPVDVRTMLLDGVDALMTALPGVCIGVSTADCVPVLLYDTANRVSAAIHAGWRGTANRIVQLVIRQMGSFYGSKPSAIKAVIGPCISQKYFEVGDEVYETFKQSGQRVDAIAVRKDKWHIDLAHANALLMEEAGISETNIDKSGICTWENNMDYFSARKQGTNSGRIYTGIII